MFENIIISLFGLLIVNYLVIIARQRIVKIVIGILGIVSLDFHCLAIILL